MDDMKKILSKSKLNSFLDSWYQAVTKMVSDVSPLAVVGIRTRGVPLAQNIRDQLEQEGATSSDSSIPLGRLDITLYRDDIHTRQVNPVVQGTDVLFDVSDYHIILVDDVLFTGRTVRAALDEIFDFGRPRSVQLAVAIDRGGRELPIQPDITGREMKDVPDDKLVRLRLEEVDEEGGVFLGPNVS